MSYYTMAFVGSAPFGSLLAGALAHWLGASNTVIISGLAVLSGSAWFTLQMSKLNTVILPIYEQMGILQPHEEHRIPTVDRASVTGPLDDREPDAWRTLP